jgi:hypothetical protein
VRISFLILLFISCDGWCQQNAMRDSVIRSATRVEYNNAMYSINVDLVFRNNTAHPKPAYLAYLDSISDQMNFYKHCSCQISLDQYNDQPDKLNQERLDFVTAEMYRRVDTTGRNFQVYWQDEDPNAFDGIFGPSDEYHEYVQQTVNISLSCWPLFYVKGDSLPFTGHYIDTLHYGSTLTEYLNGKKHGACYSWDPGGELISFHRYDNGNNLGIYDVTKDSLLAPYIGKETSYYPSGHAQKVSWYEYTPVYPTEEVRRRRGIPPGQDTVIYSVKTLYTDHFIYHPGEDPIVERAYYGKRLLLYGPEHSIGARLETTSRTHRAGDTISVVLTLKNFSDSAVPLTIPEPTTGVIGTSAQFNLQPDEYWQRRIYLVVGEGSNMDSILVVGDSIRIPFAIETYGYHLMTDDLTDDAVIALPKQFTYYRLGQEGVLKIYKKRRKAPVATIVLFAKETQVDLTHLEAGKYWIVKFDYNEFEWVRCRLILTA